jgi:hypothetical protein
MRRPQRIGRERTAELPDGRPVEENPFVIAIERAGLPVVPTGGVPRSAPSSKKALPSLRCRSCPAPPRTARSTILQWQAIHRPPWYGSRRRASARCSPSRSPRSSWLMTDSSTPCRPTAGGRPIAAKPTSGRSVGRPCSPPPTIGKPPGRVGTSRAQAMPTPTAPPTWYGEIRSGCVFLWVLHGITAIGRSLGNPQADRHVIGIGHFNGDGYTTCYGRTTVARSISEK